MSSQGNSVADSIPEWESPRANNSVRADLLDEQHLNLIVHYYESSIPECKNMGILLQLANKVSSSHTGHLLFVSMSSRLSSWILPIVRLACPLSAPAEASSSARLLARDLS